jgi:hypothetical protein
MVSPWHMFIIQTNKMMKEKMNLGIFLLTKIMFAFASGRFEGVKAWLGHQKG